MQYTNKHNLPPAIMRAVQNELYVKEGHISATELIAPVQQTQLKWRYNDKVVVDVMDEIWALLGSATHAILEWGSRSPTHIKLYQAVDRAVTAMQSGLPPQTAIDGLVRNITNLMRDLSTKPSLGRIVERRMFKYNVLGWTVSCKADLIEHHILDDYKVTKAYAIVNGIKSEWQKQLNVNRHIARANGEIIDKCRVIAILKDWSQLEATKNSQYPQQQVIVMESPLLEDQTIEKYIENRVRANQEAQKVSDEDLPPCSPEERWTKPTQFAVHGLNQMGNPKQKAYRVFETSHEAIEMVQQMNAKGNGHYMMQVRQGGSFRCEKYCAVAPFCKQWERISKEVAT